MLALAEFVAVLSGIMFTGAAVYINLVEHPARVGCDTRIAATVWAPSYPRGTIMQAHLTEGWNTKTQRNKLEGQPCDKL